MMYLGDQTEKRRGPVRSHLYNDRNIILQFTISDDSGEREEPGLL